MASPFLKRKIARLQTSFVNLFRNFGRAYEGKKGIDHQQTVSSDITRQRLQMVAQELVQLGLALVLGYLLTRSATSSALIFGKTNSNFIFWRRYLTMSAMLFVFFNVLFRVNLSGRSFRHFPLKDAFFFMSILMINLEISRFVFPYLALIFSNFKISTGFEYLIPISVGGLIIHLMMGKEAAYMYSFTYSLLLSYLLDKPYFFALWAFAVNATAIITIRSCKQRTDLYKSGVISGIISGLLVLCHGLFQSTEVTISPGLWVPAIFGVGSGLISTIVSSTIIPLFEFLFGYTTSLKLLELSNFNHPLLHELMLKAPGTYHHSIIVGSLAEIAADKIGANGLMARVAAYYHDIGKMNKPLYFIENQGGRENPHNHLAPLLSAKILFAHVKAGVRLAREYHLGTDITRVIEQHHGTTMVSYFLNKAKQMEDPNMANVQESDFRYPGPKPQIREAAVVMMADACEAATRAILEPTPSKIQNTVHNIISLRILDAQFAECDLTFRDLQQIEESFVRTLVSLYHHRIEYPQKQVAPRKQNGHAVPLKKVQNGGH